MDVNKFNKELAKECKCFLEFWGDEKHILFIEDIEKIFKFYELFQKNYIFKRVLTDQENIMMQAICTTHLVSRFAENHAKNLDELNLKFKDLWKKIEKAGGTLIEL